MNTLVYDLSIIIVSYNGLNLLKKCLVHLNNLDIPLRYEILIIDNGSSDGSQQWLTKNTKENITFRVFLLSKNLGFAKANNIGIKHSKGKFILLLNTDAFPQQDAIQILVNFLEQHPKVGIVGPQLIFQNKKWQRSYGVFPGILKALMAITGYINCQNCLYSFLWKINNKYWRVKEVEYVAGACMMIRKKLIDEIGMLDDTFFFYGEDAEFCYRSKKQGWKVFYHPHSHVIHLRGSSISKENINVAAGYKKNSQYIFIMHYYGLKTWKKFLRLMCLNFLIRCTIAKLFGLHDLYKKNKEMLNVYRGIDQF